LVYGQVIIGTDHERIENELLELVQLLQIPIEGFVLESSPKRLKLRNITELLEHETSDESSPDPAENDNIIPQGTKNNENDDENNENDDESNKNDDENDDGNNVNDDDWQCCNISFDDQPYCDEKEDLSLKITIENDLVSKEDNNNVKSEPYCQLCDTSFPSSVQAIKHLMESDIGYMCYDGKIKSKYSCSFRFCNSEFDSPIYLYRHEQRKHKDNGSPFKCKTCPESTKIMFFENSPYSLMHHEKNKHGHDIHMIFKTNHDQELTFSYKTIAPEDKKHIYDYDNMIELFQFKSR